ncbi:MAG: transcription elongation factor GreA, partial [Treponema sp.]|nr:transcription elongation factor GreA [Treponema sp.]
MAENLVTSVQSMLKEELWTREAINNYTQSKINELSSIIDQARSNNCVDEVLAVCEEHLSHTKESIIALYLAGILSIQKDRIDNSYLITLVDIFQKNHKEAIVVKLCEDILSDDENNKFALRTLAECYVAEGKPEVWGLYEKIVKIDFKEAELAKVLADHYSSLNDMETAINYYKKSILRYINIENYNASKELWSKLVTLIPEEIDFFQLLRRKIAKRFSAYKTTTLMQELYDWYKQNEKWDTAI